MNQATNPINKAQNPATRGIKMFVGGYVAISLGAILALIALHNHPAQATQEAWVHGIIVAATALLVAIFTRGTLKGNPRAYLRLRISSSVMIIAIAVTSAIPGDFPVWMKVEQTICGLLLIGLAVVLNRKNTRAFFSAK